MGNSPENRFGPQDREYGFLGLAERVSGRNFPNTDDGFTEAIAAMQEQHQKVMPGFSHDEVALLVNQWESVHLAEVLAHMTLRNEKLGEAVYFSNQLFVYGEVDLQRDLGNRAFQISLSFHRQFANLIKERFSKTDPYLIEAGRVTFSDIDQSREIGDQQLELSVLRMVIHGVALNGTLGEKAKENVDPMALVSF